MRFVQYLNVSADVGHFTTHNTMIQTSWKELQDSPAVAIEGMALMLSSDLNLSLSLTARRGCRWAFSRFGKPPA